MNGVFLSAVQSGNIDIVDFLLERGAGLDINSEAMYTFDHSGSGHIDIPLIVAARNEHVEVVSRLLRDTRLAIQAGGVSELHAAMGPERCNDSDRRTDILRMLLLDDRFDYDVRGAFSQDTLLHYAVERRHVKATRFLLESGNIDINSMNFRGDTVLHVAMYQPAPCEEIIDLLLRWPGIQVRRFFETFCRVLRMG